MTFLLIVFFIYKLDHTALILSARDMDKKERKIHERKTSISKAGTIEEISEVWGTHSLADYLEQTHESDFDVRAKHRNRITIDPEV